MADLNFKFGTLIRTGPKLERGGKWDATLEDEVRNARTNAALTISIRVNFVKINPAAGRTGTHNDTDSRQRRIQRWALGEFEHYTSRLLRSAQKYWSGVFWLRPPHGYEGFDCPEARPTHRCNVYCRLDLALAHNATDAHYTIAAVRVQDGEVFRSNSVLYSQKDIQSESLIPQSTVGFWTHFHEVGHLLGLGHVGWAGNHNLHANNSPRAYGVTRKDQIDVMGMGSVRRHWHALAWQQAAAVFTDTKPKDWTVHVHYVPPRLIRS